MKSRDENEALKEELRSTKDKLSTEQARKQMLERDLENLNERLRSDQTTNQRQIACLREEHTRDKKLLDERIVALSSTNAQEIKAAQDANTALRAELKGSDQQTFFSQIRSARRQDIQIKLPRTK